jgi:hypothetical protein
MDEDTPLRQALQNDSATRACVAERHTAVRFACWSLTPAAREFAAAKTSLHRRSASVKAKARLHTRGAPEPGTSLCAKATSRIHTRGVPGPGSSSLSTPCPTLLRVSARLVHTSEFLSGEMGQAPLRSTLLYRPRSRSGHSRREPKENRSQGPITRQHTFPLKVI